jgi:hypothetical protein
MMVRTVALVAAAALTSVNLTVPVIFSFAPVVVGMQAETIERTSDTYTATISGRKIKDCHAIGPFVGWYQAGGKWLQTPFSAVSGAGLVDASMSPQQFGTFQWAGLPADVERVRVTTTHQCGNALELTVAGPFAVPSD